MPNDGNYADFNLLQCKLRNLIGRIYFWAGRSINVVMYYNLDFHVTSLLHQQFSIWREIILKLPLIIFGMFYYLIQRLRRIFSFQRKRELRHPLKEENLAGRVEFLTLFDQ